MKCAICSEDGIFKIKGEKIYYCKLHAEEFFSKNCLESVKKLEQSQKEAQILKKYIDFNKEDN